MKLYPAVMTGAINQALTLIRQRAGIPDTVLFRVGVERFGDMKWTVSILFGQIKDTVKPINGILTGKELWMWKKKVSLLEIQKEAKQKLPLGTNMSFDMAIMDVHKAILRIDESGKQVYLKSLGVYAKKRTK
jgi:hypothetical protein